MTRVIVTRPEPQCSVWVQAIQDAGFEAIAGPLIHIKPLAFEWKESQTFDAVMWVSRSAVENFQHSLPQAAWHLASGLGTVESLIQCGVQRNVLISPSANAAQFDSETLWQAMCERGLNDWANKRVLIVRGTNRKAEAMGRNWLADTLTAQGAAVEFVSCYQRALPSDFVLPLTQNDDVWLFSSSESIQHLQLVALIDSWSNTRALCTHPRIAQAALDAGFGRVSVCAPRVSDVLKELGSDPN